MRRRIVAVLMLVAGMAAAPPALGAAYPASVPLPDDFAPEGIAVGKGSTFYAGSLTTGDIYRGSLRSGEGAVFIDAPDGGFALGLKADVRRDLLFVAGGPTGTADVYVLSTGAPVASYAFGPPGASLLNDVVVTRDAAYFTDSFAPVLYRIPISPSGDLGPGSTIALSGPAAFMVENDFNLNGIDATPNGSALVVGNGALGALFTVDPETGDSAAIDVDGLTPGTVDGLLLEGRRLWVVENFANRLVEVTLNRARTSGEITREITSPLFRVPATVARHGRRLALVNARFDLGFPPPFGPGAPAGTDFDVVVVRP